MTIITADTSKRPSLRPVAHSRSRSLTCSSLLFLRLTEFDDAVSAASGLVVVDFHAQWWLVSAHFSARGQMKREVATREWGAELSHRVAYYVVLSLALLLLWSSFLSGIVGLGESLLHAVSSASGEGTGAGKGEEETKRGAELNTRSPFSRFVRQPCHRTRLPGLSDVTSSLHLSHSPLTSCPLVVDRNSPTRSVRFPSTSPPPVARLTCPSPLGRAAHLYNLHQG
jgi:hypothetical protein